VKVFKYPLLTQDRQVIELPEGATILHIGDQVETICVWAMVDPVATKKCYEVHIAGTGHLLPDDLEGFDFLGTTIQKFLAQSRIAGPDGRLPPPRVKTLVWHVWGRWV